MVLAQCYSPKVWTLFMLPLISHVIVKEHRCDMLWRSCTALPASHSHEQMHTCFGFL